MKRVTTKRRVELGGSARRRNRGHAHGASHTGRSHSPKTHESRHLAGKDAHRRQTRAALAPSQAKRQRVDPQYLTAIKAFEQAVRLFRRQNFAKARQIFDKLSSSVYPEVADRAKLHLRLCEQRKNRPAPLPKSAQEYYVLGVAELNARQLDSAVERLSKADRLEPNREHIHYALAAAHALKGQTDTAIRHLQLAVSLRPQNVFQARDDDDFRSLASDPRFKTLVGQAGLVEPRDSRPPGTA